MVKLLIFDIGGVLMHDADSWSTLYKGVLKKTGLPKETIDNTWNKHWDAMCLGKESLLDFFDDLVTQANNGITTKELTRIYKDETKVNNGVVSYIRFLKKQKFRITILSNDTIEGIEFRINKISHLFDGIYVSAELGMKKPHSNIFEYVLSREKIKPSEALFIDDRERNVQAARDLGITGLVFKDLEKLKEDMQSHLGK